MSEAAGPPERDGSRERLELWKKGVRKDYHKACGILRRWAGVSEDRAYDCLNTAVQELLWQWRNSGPPAYIEHWAAYLAQSAFHVHIRPPRKDAKILVFMPPVADKKNPVALDTPTTEPEPPENAIRREEFEKVWKVLVRLPKPQVGAVVLWALGLDFKEIAHVLEVSESHARSLKYKGVMALKKRLGVSISEVRSTLLTA